MAKYIIRRVLLFVPNLLLVSLLVFAISALIPGSPVLNRMPSLQDISEGRRSEAFRYEKEYTRQAVALGLDKPLFYFSVRSSALPDTLYRIFPETRRQQLVQLARNTGSWKFTQTFTWEVRSLIRDVAAGLDEDSTGQWIRLEKELRFLLEEQEPDRIDRRMPEVGRLGGNIPSFASRTQALLASWNDRADAREKARWWIPACKWNGTDNRYHHWISGVLRGDIGSSVKDGQAAMGPIIKALRWTLLLNIIALIGTLLVAIPMGIYAAWWKGSAFDRWSHRFVYLFYSVPGFWLASLSIVFLTSDAYGSFWHWFDSAGVTDYRPDLSFAENLGRLYPDLLLPAVILILPSLAFLFRQTRTAMLEEMGKSYAVTARARGLSERDLLWRTLLPNASFPILTMIGGAIPGLISGSLIMEVIFAIPGMGRLMYEAMLSQDWNVLQGVILIGTLLVMFSYLITDLLYAFMNPKVKLS